jgi:ATP phosphoribosyltransferase
MSVKENLSAEKSTSDETQQSVLRMTIPTGRIQEKVINILNCVGVRVSNSGRSYKPACSDAGIEIKLLKSQNIPSLIALGRHECGFSGGDWIQEQKADVVELLDLEFDPVRIVAAVPEAFADKWKNAGRKIVIASEYRELSARFIDKHKLDAVFLQSFGATEALPPEDADMIIDNTATGSTLRANRLVEVETLMHSTTRFIANREVMKDKAKAKKLEEIAMLMQSALKAREKVLLEMNVSKADFAKLVAELPCMRAPTIAELYNGDGYAIKIAVASRDVPGLIPKIVALGGRDILEYKLEKIVG